MTVAGWRGKWRRERRRKGERPPQPDRILSGHGLENMKRRLAAIGGNATLRRANGKWNARDLQRGPCWFAFTRTGDWHAGAEPGA
jgi:hypothetical protein